MLNKLPSKVLEIKDVTVSYGGTKILDSLSFDIERGEITAILGPNGSGKTTLIKAVLVLIPIQKGEIKILGLKVKDALPLIGYLPQRFEIDRSFPITVEEFLDLSLHKNTPKEEIDGKLAEVDMLMYKKALLGTLSGGQFQRILIARAILNNPEILILDEPETGIDVGAEKNFYQLILHLNEKHGITTVFISHELELIYDFAKQVVCLNRALVCHGVPRKVLTPEKLEELYGGGLTHHQHTHPEETQEEMTHHIGEHAGKHTDEKDRHETD